MARTQAQLQESQRQLDAMRAQLAALQSQLSQTTAATTDTTKAIDDLRERQEMQATQIATHDQIKVETASKYPLKITGQLLFNGFVNTRAVDAPSTPTLALPGSGSTGATVRQTVLGFDARGPHILGAQSYADLHVDFAGSPPTSGTSTGISYTGYASNNATLLRLRTAHAGLRWDHTEAYFSLDRPIFSPDSPATLTAVAEPALAWSGNLWTWNPQLGITHDLPFATTHALRLQAALVDVGDAPLPVPSAAAAVPPTLSEQSRWPGVEARIAVLGSTTPDEGSHIGIGGYFAPHRDPLGYRFDSWAGTLDTRLQLPAHFALTGSFYRGQSLGGLGAGAYKDLAYRTSMTTGSYRYRPLSDVGGWAQLQQTVNARLQFNAAFGIDNAFANELRRYASPTGTIYQNLARNRTYTGNVIYSPSAYLVFSLEYRHLISSPISSPATSSNIIGLGAGYRF
ncbi:hypothetical protein FTO74_17735 [Granulicella sp. WH15]|nr:hypothetical protein FTO74_17735 [Granulicella sp. WH15]